MLDQTTLAVFLVASFVMLVTPGPAVLYIIARSIDQGHVAGITSACGAGVGTLIHVAAAVSGVSALLVSSALAFMVVKYLGAVYLVYLGIKTLLAPPLSAQIDVPEPRMLSRVFYQGIIVNLLNPKVALFFFAFLPQFVEPARGSAVGQMLLLGSLFVAMGIISDSLYALLAGTVRDWLKQSTAFLRGQRYFAGSVYIAPGMTTALSGTDNS
jgi:threonine/homoserine/homoserine lactone efflux protein